MAKCSFCGNVLLRGTGLMFVKKDGAVYFFCSHKCEKNMLDMGRSPQAKKWALAWQKGGRAKAAKKKGEKQ